MLKMVLMRILWAIATFFFVSIIIFVAIEALPGDMATAYLGREITPASYAFYREEFGLNRPLFVRYFEWFFGMIRGDFGTSPLRSDTIYELIIYRLRNTVVLGLMAALIGIPLAIVLGVYTALNRDLRPDIILSSISLGMMTLPEFVVAALLIFIFGIRLKWFPAISILPADTPIRELLPNVWLPIITLTTVMIAHILRLVRTSIIDVMQSDFVVTAILKGVPLPRVILLHALPNAMLPTINVIALTVAWLMSGSIIIEAMFNYPGIGSMMLIGITSRDFMLVQAIVMVLAAVYIGLNLAADLISLFLNPRLRSERGS